MELLDVIDSAQKILDPLVQLIEFAVRNDPKNRGQWVKDVTKLVFEKFKGEHAVFMMRENQFEHRWWEYCNVVATQHIEYKGSGFGNDWGSIGFRVVVLRPGKPGHEVGYINNCKADTGRYSKEGGDGDYINWCFIGGWRKDDQPKTVFFS